MKFNFAQVATLSTAAFVAPVTAQTPILWSGTLNNLGNGDWATATNWAGSNTPDSSTELADFRADWTGTAPTVTLNGDYTVNGIQFNDTGAAGDLALTINAGNTITLAGTAPVIQVDAGTLTIAATLAGNTAWAKSINPNIGILAGTSGALVLTGDSPSATGAVSVDTGNLSLGTATVATGSLAGAAAYTVRNGTLALVNTFGNANRLNDTGAVNLNLGGVLSLAPNATTNTSETIGAINLSQGGGTVSVTSAASRITTLAAASLNRGANQATALLRGTSLTQTVATNVARITLADSGASLNFVGTTTLNNAATGDATKTVKIVPWLHGDSSGTGTGNGFVTYDTTLGIRVLTAAQNTVLTAGYTTPVTLENVSATGALTLANSVTVNSLTMRAASASLNGTSTTLTVASGAVGTDGTATQSLGSGFSSLILQNGEGFFHVGASTLTVNTPVNVAGTGTGGLTKGGAGTVNLTAANLYTGPTTVNARALTLSGVSSNDTRIYIRGGTLNFNTIGNVGGAASALGIPSSVAQGTIELGGNLIFNGIAPASSDRNINLQPYADARFAQLNNAATGGPHMLSMSGAVTGDGNLLVRGAGGDITLSGIVSNNGSISHTETRTLLLQNPANSFSGPLLAFAGTISVPTVSDIGLNSAIGSGSSIGLGQASTSGNTGTFQFTGSSGGSTNRPVIVTNNGVIENTVAGQTLSLSGGFSVGAGTVDATPTLRLIGAGDGAQTGSITGTGFEILKEGAGTWALSGTNSYTGITSITGGSLRINGDHTAASGAITVATTATLGGSGTLGGLVTVQNGGTLAPGNSPGTLTTIGAVVFSPSSNLSWELNGTDTTIGGGVNDLFTGVTTITLDGTLNISETVTNSFLSAAPGSIWRLINYTGVLTDNTLTLGTTPAVPSGYIFGIDSTINGQVNLTLVPEPGTAALLAMALAAGTRRRRRV